jgi:hypothetical protein
MLKVYKPKLRKSVLNKILNILKTQFNFTRKNNKLKSHFIAMIIDYQL